MDRRPMDWPTAVVLIAFFAFSALAVWAIAWAVRG